MKTKYQTEKGFSLVEALVVITLIGILMSVAIPYFHGWLVKYEAKKSIDQLMPVFVNARHHAYSMQQHVVICPTHDKTQCAKPSPTIMSFIDINKNKQRDAHERLLSISHVDLKYGMLKFNIGLGRAYVRFFPDTGKPRGYFGNVTYCPKNNDMTHAKALIFNKHGRIRTSYDSNQDGREEGSNRRPLVC